MNKKEQRRLIIEKRNKLSNAEISDKSDEIAKKVLDYIKIFNVKSVYAYAGASSEVSTEAIINTLLNEGIRVALPRVDDIDSCIMSFYEIHDYVSDMKIGAYNILEPTALNAADFYPDIIIMPGVAFDKEKNRIGYGKGYYDRFLERFEKEKIIKLGLAFQLQIVDKICIDENDKKLDTIITEEKIYE